MSNDWPDSQTFWRDKRVIVTGGAGFLGSFIVDKLRERSAAEISVPRRNDYDLRDIIAIRQLLADTSLPLVSGRRSISLSTWPCAWVASGRTASTPPNCARLKVPLG